MPSRRSNVTAVPAVARSGAGRPVEPLAVLGPHLHRGVSLSVCAAEAGVPLRTAQRWLATYRRSGAAALVRAKRSDAGLRKPPAELIGLIEGLALRKPPPRISEVFRTVCRVAGELGWSAPSYPTVRRVIAAMDPGLLTLAHHGTAAYRDRFELVFRFEAGRPNDVWQADHTQLDILVKDDLGRRDRPWLTVILDDQSRVVAGYTVFVGDPTAWQTALALRQAVWRKTDPAWPVCGLPSVLYSDHGSDFTSEHMAQVCADTKIDLVHSTPGVPRGRGKIERIFGTVTTELLPTLPGYIPPGNRGEPVTEPALTLSELDAAVGSFLIDTYNQRVHPETGQAPVDRWKADGWLPRMPDSLEQLDLLLLTVAKPRKVQRDGVHCHGLRYVDLTLAAYVGEEVTVRYDPRDLAEIRVFHRGRFLCRALAPELAAASITLKDLQAARTRRRRELREQLTSRRSLADLLTHPVPESVPSDAPLFDRPAAQPPVDPAPRHRLKLYRED